MSMPNWTAENSLNVGRGYRYLLRVDYHPMNIKTVSPQYVDPCPQCTTWACRQECLRKLGPWAPWVWW